MNAKQAAAPLKAVANLSTEQDDSCERYGALDFWFL
jgi:hypothetical protein